jgi:hypothetical protein
VNVEINPLAQEFADAYSLDLRELIVRHLKSGYVESVYCYIDGAEMLELVVSTLGDTVYIDLCI